MGRGDRRTRRGKIWKHSFGKCRPRKVAAVTPTPVAPKKKADKKSG